MKLTSSFLALLALLPAATLSAKSASVTVSMGENWLFAIERGRPVQARRVNAAAKPARGELLVAVRAMMGTTMTVTNNSQFDYAYRAILVMPGGKRGPSKSCAVPANGRMAIEHWSKPVAAIRLSDFMPAPAGSLCP